MPCLFRPVSYRKIAAWPTLSPTASALASDLHQLLPIVLFTDDDAVGDGSVDATVPLDTGTGDPSSDQLGKPDACTNGFGRLLLQRR